MTVKQCLMDSCWQRRSKSWDSSVCALWVCVWWSLLLGTTRKWLHFLWSTGISPDTDNEWMWGFKCSEAGGWEGETERGGREEKMEGERKRKRERKQDKLKEESEWEPGTANSGPDQKLNNGTKFHRWPHTTVTCKLNLHDTNITQNTADHVTLPTP